MIPIKFLVFENDALENDVDAGYQISSWNKVFDSLHARK